MKARDCVLMIVVLYLASLTLPALRLDPTEPDDPGVLGIFCLTAVPYACIHPAWWANLFLLVGFIRLTRRDYRRAWRMGLVATALSLSFVTYMGPGSLMPGALCWIASIVTLAAAGYGLDRTPAPPALGTETRDAAQFMRR